VIENEGGVALTVGLDEIQAAPPRKPAPAPEAAEPKPPVGDVPPPAAPFPAAAPVQEAAPAAPVASSPARPPKGRRPYWIRACAAAEVPENGSFIADVGGPAMAVFNLGGKFHVLENACPHQGGPLGAGKIEGSVVVCPLHQWKFDIPTGRGLSIPGPCARRYSAVVLGGDVFVGV
jgi:nitrite reductase/ring-hydroxylating ferredoxin subunit